MRPLVALGRDSRRRRALSTVVSSGYAFIAMLAFGGIAVETIVIYPNVFRDVPGSLARASGFFTVTGPADFFPPLGLVSLLIAVLALVVCWPVRRARWWIGAALALWVVADLLFSVLFFWPRNEIMFDEGPAVHSAATLAQAAVEFETGHWGRLAGSAVTAALAFAGMWQCLRHRVVMSHAARTESA